MLILNTLAPVFLLVTLGVWLQRSGFVSPGFLKEANRLTYWVGLPALLFSQLAAALPSVHAAGALLATVLTGTVGVIIFSYGVAALLRVPGAAMGTFVQGAFRGNLAFVGLPVIFALPDVPVAGGLTVRSAAIIAVAPAMVLYNLAGVIVLLLSQHRLGFAMVKPLVRQLLVTPPLLATVAGIAFAAMGWRLPVAVDRTLFALGEMALPLGLLGVGGSLMTVNLAAGWRLPGISALIKTAVSPAIGWVLGRWWGLEPAALQVAMILMACPTAIVSYTMVLAMKGDEEMASSTIVASVVCSLATLALIVGIF